MNFVFFGHLQLRSLTHIQAVLLGGILALPEYGLQVPACRIDFLDCGVSADRLKMPQECIIFIIFVISAGLARGEGPGLQHAITFPLNVPAVTIAFY